jgi:prophage regulatory protein
MNMAKQFHETLAVLRRKQVEARVGLRRSSLYQRISEGSFPAPIKLGGRAVGWIEAEITEWLANRVAERGGQREACQ